MRMWRASCDPPYSGAETAFASRDGSGRLLGAIDGYRRLNRPTLRLEPGSGPAAAGRLSLGVLQRDRDEAGVPADAAGRPGPARRRRRRAVRHLHVQSAQPDRGAAAGSRSGSGDRRGLAACAACARRSRCASACLRHALPSLGARRGGSAARPGDRPLRRCRGVAGQHRRDGSADAADRGGADRLAAAARGGRAQ